MVALTQNQLSAHYAWCSHGGSHIVCTDADTVDVDFYAHALITKRARKYAFKS